MPDLPQIHRWCDEARPLFISGLARSGTSMLCAALARHPALFPLRRPGETFVFIKPRTGLTVEPPPTGLREYLGTAEALQLLRQRLAQADARQGHELADLDVARLFFHVLAHEIHPGRRPLEKTPGHALKLDAVFQAFPQALALVCVRDPVEIVASYRKRLQASRVQGLPPERLAWLDRSIEEMIRIFQRFGQAMDRAQQRHGQRLLLLPYRAVTQAPEPSLRQICRAAGLDDCETLAAPLPEHELGFRGGAIAPRGDDHADWVSAEEAAQVREACAPWLATWCASQLQSA